jgi:hypothetical protein
VIAAVAAFEDYFEGVRRRTIGFFHAIPRDRIDWTPLAGEYTCGDIIRHVAASERMFVGAALDGRWRYAGHDRRFGATLGDAFAHLDACHAEATAALRRAGDVERLATGTTGRNA